MPEPGRATGKFPRSARVRRRREFLRIQSDGIRVHTDAFTIVACARSEAGGPRLGCAVSRRVGNAVMRNRIRRLLKEVFRGEAHRLSGVDFVIIARSSAAALVEGGRAAVASEVVPAMERANRMLAKREPTGRAKDPMKRGGRSS